VVPFCGEPGAICKELLNKQAELTAIDDILVSSGGGLPASAR
jgi:hypothetical protein